MPLPVTFATLTQGNQPLSLLDTQFSALSALIEIPCVASGQNTITLTPANNTPTIAAYTNLTPTFAWVQPQTTTGAVTIGLAGLTQLNAYGSNGGVALGSGDLSAGNTYICSFNSALNSGAGGFVVDSFSAVTTLGNWVPILRGDSVAGTPTYTTQAGSYEQVGRQVTARFVIVTTALTGCTGNMQITGLPLTNNSIFPGMPVFSQVSGWTPGGAYSVLGGVVNASTTTIILLDWGPGVATRASPVTDFAAATSMYGFVTYHV